MNWLVKNFLRGLIILLPIVVTLYLAYQLFARVDRLLDLHTPGLGFLITILIVLGTGVLASNFIGRKFFELMERLFSRAPFIRIVYSSIKDLLEAFVGDKKRFNRPVAVRIGENIRTLGFVTQDDLSFIAMPGYVSVYLPFCYSVAGSLIVVAHSDVQLLDADSAQVMALIVSGGVSRQTT